MIPPIPHPRRKAGFILVLSTVLAATSLPARSETAPSFAGLGENVVAAFSATSWNNHWRTIRAEKAPAKILDSLIHDALPSALALAGATGELLEIPARLDAFRSSIDWKDLADSRLAGVVWTDERKIPQITLEVTPGGDGRDKVLADLGALLKFIADNSDSTLEWSPRPGGGGALEIAEEISDGTDALPYSLPLAVLHASGRSLHLDVGFDPKPAHGRPGMLAQEGMADLWNRTPPSVVTAAAMDFTRLIELKHQTDALIASQQESFSSLVLDETLEALFSDDRETLEKLRQVEEGMGVITDMRAPSPLKALTDRIFSLVADQGVLLSTVSPDGDNVLLTTLWKPRAGTEGAGLYDLRPVDPRFLGLLGPGMLEVSVRALPDFANLVRLLKDLIASYGPEGEQILAQWEEIQKSVGFHLESDLLPALGRETAWMTQGKEAAPTFGVPVINSTLYFALSLQDLGAAKRSLDRIETLLVDSGFPVKAEESDGVPYSVVETGLVGSFRWTLLDSPPTLVATTAPPGEYLSEWIARLQETVPDALEHHPRWDEMRAVWTVEPTAVSLSDTAAQWKQQLDSLKGSQMLVAMLGSAAGAVLPLMRLSIAAMENTEPPEASFRVDQNREGVRESRQLFLYPRR